MRIAGPGDVSDLTRLINLAFRVERFFHDDDRLDDAEVRRRLDRGVFLIEEDLAGCVYVEQRGDRAYIGLLSVDPARQRNGLGKRLMAAAEMYSRERGCRFADLQIVNLREELPPFYRGLGYAETGTEPFTSGVATTLPCHFVTMSKAL